MWKIIHIFDGDYGCEEQTGVVKVSVTLENEAGQRRIETVPDRWLTEQGLDVGDLWPDYSDLVLETEDLLLKKPQFEHWPSIYKNLWRHQESARYMLWSPTCSPEEAQARMERTCFYQRHTKYAFLVYEKSTGEAIGFAGMMEIEPDIYEDIGVALGPSYVGKGYGAQVVNALLREAKASGGTKFITSCRTENAASRRLQKKCGFLFSHFEDRVDPRTGAPYVLEFTEKQL